MGSVVGSLVGPVLQAIGQPGRQAWLSWVAATVSGVALLVFANGPTESPVVTQMTALAVIKLVLNSVLFLVIDLTVVSRAVNLPRRALFAALVPGSIAGGAGFLAGWLADRVMVLFEVPPILRAAAVGGVASVVANSVIAGLDITDTHRTSPSPGQAVACSEPLLRSSHATRWVGEHRSVDAATDRLPSRTIGAPVGS